MVQKTQKFHINNGAELTIVNPNAAGISVDVGEIHICVPPDRYNGRNRYLANFTDDLREVCGWLKECSIDTVAMEATGILWVPLFLKIKKAGIDVVLVNTHEVKNISGKKTDAHLLMSLHTFGLLKATSLPKKDVRQVKDLADFRNFSLTLSVKQMQDMLMIMEKMNIQSDIVDKFGISIINDILSGNHTPESLASLAGNCYKPGRKHKNLPPKKTFDKSLISQLSQNFQLYNCCLNKIEKTDYDIQEILKPYIINLDSDMANFEE